VVKAIIIGTTITGVGFAAGLGGRNIIASVASPAQTATGAALSQENQKSMASMALAVDGVVVSGTGYELDNDSDDDRSSRKTLLPFAGSFCRSGSKSMHPIFGVPGAVAELH
jgi:hypothetical protein